MKNIALIFLLMMCSSITGFAQIKKQVQNKSKATAPKSKNVRSSEAAPAQNQSERRVQISTDYGVIILKLYNETPKHRDNFIKLVKEGFYDSLLFHRVIQTFMIQGGDPNSKHADTSEMLGAGDVGYKIPAEIHAKYYHKKGALAAARDNNPEKASSGCQFYIVQGKTYTLKELEQIINNRNMSRKQQVLYDLYQRDTVQATINAFQMSANKEETRKYIEKLQPAADAEFNAKYPNSTYVNMDQMEVYQKVGGAPQLDGDYTIFGMVESGLEVIDKIAAVSTRSSDNRPLKNVRMKIRLLE